jgi:hypothetical protein
LIVAQLRREWTFKARKPAARMVPLRYVGCAAT